jgi:hypothetical protein
MKFAFSIFFTGITFLLTGGDTLEVVVPRFAESVAPSGTTIPAHVAYLKFRIEDVPNFSTEAKPRPDFIFVAGEDDPKTDQYAIYVLRGERVTVTGVDAKPKFDVCKKSADCPIKLIDPDLTIGRDTFEHVPHLRDVCKHARCGRFDTDFLKEDEEYVAARLSGPIGVLSTDPSIKMAKWSFHPMKTEFLNPHEQLLAQRVALDMLSAENKFVVRITPFKPTDRHKEVVLTFVPKIRGRGIEIGNVPAADLLMINREHSLETVDHHFALYYKLLRQPVPSDPPLPHRPQPTPEGAIHGANCPPLADDN